MTLEQEFSSEDACDLTGVTYRQLEYWCNCGYLGGRLVGRGSGSRRRFTSHDVEVLDAIGSLRALGCYRSGANEASSQAREDALLAAIDVVRARPVAPDGELLVVTLDPPRAQRWEHVCVELGGPPAWVVPLRSFSTVALPAGVSDVPAGRSHLLPAGSGAVESDPSHTGFPRLDGSNNEGGACCALCHDPIGRMAAQEWHTPDSDGLAHVVCIGLLLDGDDEDPSP